MSVTELRPHLAGHREDAHCRDLRDRVVAGAQRGPILKRHRRYRSDRHHDRASAGSDCAPPGSRGRASWGRKRLRARALGAGGKPPWVRARAALLQPPASRTGPTAPTILHAMASNRGRPQ